MCTSCRARHGPCGALPGRPPTTSHAPAHSRLPPTPAPRPPSAPAAPRRPATHPCTPRRPQSQRPALCSPCVQVRACAALRANRAARAHRGRRPPLLPVPPAPFLHPTGWRARAARGRGALPACAPTGPGGGYTLPAPRRATAPSALWHTQTRPVCAGRRPGSSMGGSRRGSRRGVVLAASAWICMLACAEAGFESPRRGGGGPSGACAAREALHTCAWSCLAWWRACAALGLPAQRRHSRARSHRPRWAAPPGRRRCPSAPVTPP